MTKAKGVRGIRNNNPGNIEKGAPWQGLMPVSQMTPYQRAEDRFAVFKDPVYGIRAIAVTLITYQDKRRAKDKSKIDTIQEIIDRWAPATENDTAAYQRKVTRLVGVGVNDTIDVHEYETMRPLVEAIITHEVGSQPYTAAQIDKGLALAGIEPPHGRLRASKTVKAGTAGVGIGTVTAATGAITAAAPAVEGLSYIADTVRGNVGTILVLVGIALVVVAGVCIYRRWDDARKLVR